MTLINFKTKNTGTATNNKAFSREDIEAVQSLHNTFLTQGVARDYKMNFSDDHLSFDFYFSALDDAPTYTLHIYMNDDGGFDYEARAQLGQQIERSRSLTRVIDKLEAYGLKNKPLNVDWAKYAVHDQPRTQGALAVKPAHQENRKKDLCPNHTATILTFPGPRKP